MSDTIQNVQKSLSDRALWIERGILLVLILVLAGFLTWTARERADLRKEVDELKAENANLVVKRDATQKDLDKAAKKVIDNDETWQERVAALEKELGEKLKVIEVLQWRTKTAEATARGDPTPRECTKSEMVQPNQETPTESSPTKLKVIVAEGDKGHVAAGEVTYGTKNGATVLLTKARCVRETPSEFSFWDSIIETTPPPLAIKAPNDPRYRWGGGFNLDLQDTGVMGTGKLLFPPVEANLLLFHTQVETELGLGLGSGGHWQVHTGVGFRFK